MNKKLLSQCCNAPLLVSEGDEGTSFYYCQQCQKPSDPLHGESIGKQCTCPSKVTEAYKNVHETRCPMVSNEDTKDCTCGCHDTKYAEALYEAKLMPVGCEHCTPTDTDTKEVPTLVSEPGTNVCPMCNGTGYYEEFYNHSDKKFKKKCGRCNAGEPVSSTDTWIKGCEHKDCSICQTAPSVCSRHMHESVGTTEIGDDLESIIRKHLTQLNVKSILIKAASVFMASDIEDILEADHQRSITEIEKLKPHPSGTDSFERGLYSGFLNCKGKVLEILTDKKGEHE